MQEELAAVLSLPSSDCKQQQHSPGRKACVGSHAVIELLPKGGGGDAGWPRPASRERVLWAAARLRAPAAAVGSRVDVDPPSPAACQPRRMQRGAGAAEAHTG